MSFNDLRDDASSGFYEEAAYQPAEGTSAAQPQQKGSAPRRSSKSNGKFLGMTPQQRFIIAVLLMVSVCTLGLMCNLITGRMGF